MRNIVIAALFVVFTSLSQAQTSDPDWPCVQVLVPSIVVSVYWPAMISDAEATNWKQESSVAAFAESLGNIDDFTEKEQLRIVEFADALPENSKATLLNQLAFGTVAVANDRRSFYLKGIKKYTRQQTAIAAQIEQYLNELATLEEIKNDTQATARKDMEDTLYWHQRVYDQREQAIRSLCDRPVVLEQTLSSVLREMAQHLP